MFDQTSVASDGVHGDAVIPAWMRLHREMKSATRRRCAWDAEHARHLREAEALQLWNHFGYISILEYLEREHGIEPRTASDRLRVSQALADLPLLEADLEDGTFQYSHVKELTRVVTPETEDEWIAAARGKTCGEVQAMVAGRRKGDGPRDPVDPDLRTRDWPVPMTPQMEAIFRTRRVELEAELGHRLGEQELWQLILERSGECREGASTPVQVTMCVHCDRGWQDGAGRAAELEPAELERLLCDAEHLGSVEGEPVRKTATLTPKRRTRVIARDGRRCAVPGCRSAKNLDVHHIKHRADGGTHEDANLVTLCSGHHRAHHQGRLAISGRAPDAIVFAWKAVVEDGVDPSATQRAHVGTSLVQRAHVGTSLVQRAHVGTSPDRHSSVGTATDADEDSHLRGGTDRRVASPRSTASPRFSTVVARTQARDALVGMGWKIGIASAVVDEALAHVGADARIEVLIREALRRCPRPTG